jgi:FkbM family methyltransferase
LNSYPLRAPGLNADLRLFVHSASDVHISTQIRECGIWEAYETQLLLRYLRPGDCFLDVGANIGYFTVIAAALVGVSGSVYAFEPEPANFSLLQKNVELNDLQQQVFVQQAALADSDGELVLHLHADNLGDHQVFASTADRARVTVPGLRGAAALAGKVDAVNLVKVDTQGAELMVVRGLMPVLQASGSALRMIVELTPFSLRGAGSSGTELVALLAQLGLPLAIIDHLEHALVPTSATELVRWCENVDACPGDQGFMNIFVGELEAL